MIIRKFLLIIRLSVLSLLILSNKASAQTTTAYGTVTVQIVVRSSCTIAANTLSFGNYSAAAVNTTTSLNVTCTNTTPYKVGLSAGSGSGATVTTRKMTSGVKTLNYSLYQDAARTIVWGNTKGTDTINGTGTGMQQAITVYGNIPANQSAATGSYVDTITATVYF